ncbi:hypothetical protein SAMN06296386_11225 [Lachnospiraceae bacterium]|nr:hypothetical protein SAMN06296386_11225 [Lachnospiraceae bacterium]
MGVAEWKKSNEIYDWMKSVAFAGDNVPKIELKKVFYKYKKLDVLVIKQSCSVPFYIDKNYMGVNPFQIYTRVGDTNTPKNTQASYADVERLWGYHRSRNNNQ